MSPRPSHSPSSPTPPPTPPSISSERSFLSKGKEKATADLGDDDTQSFELQTPVYPPTNDDNAETRRIEETLRQWDAAERQRRKTARESGLARTASLLWSARRPEHGNHVALQSQENISSVSLNDTPTASPSSSQHSVPQNPFSDPSESRSPFSDPIPTKQRLPPGPPMPLDLPPPRTPPPIKLPPSPTSPPSTSQPTGNTHDNSQSNQTLWWHEWLCGCTEGPERGGDYQSGRTNPFE
ncbi:hypothetical protein H0H93_008617 [Arthromyces matolae]|nr:hypothetical protein H0H93_008617 [Arthromyces matolae]